MSEFDPTAMLKKVRKLREDKLSQRTALDHEISGLDKTIEGLSALCEPIPDEPIAVSSVAQEMLKYAGLTDVVRMCLQASPIPIAPADIVARLNEASYPMNTLDNPRATITTILSRLVAAGEVERKEKGENVLYAWIARRVLPRASIGRKLLESPSLSNPKLKHAAQTLGETLNQIGKK